MIARYGPTFVGLAAKRTQGTMPLPAARFKASSISAKDISIEIGGSKSVAVRVFSAEDISSFVSTSKYIDIETTAGTRAAR